MSATYQKSVYNQNEEDTDEIRGKKLVTLISSLSNRQNLYILDVGCGDGRVLSYFAKNNKCFGVDISEVPLIAAKKKNIKTYCVDLENEKLPFESNYFDTIICSEVIEHICNSDNLLHEINRVLKMRGYFILTFPNVNQPISWLMGIFLDLPPRFSARYKSPHVKDYTLKIMKKILKKFGFNIISVEGTFVYPSRGPISKLLAKIFPRLAEKIIIVATKKKKPQVAPLVIWDSRYL